MVQVTRDLHFVVRPLKRWRLRHCLRWISPLSLLPPAQWQQWVKSGSRCQRKREVNSRQFVCNTNAQVRNTGHETRGVTTEMHSTSFLWSSVIKVGRTTCTCCLDIRPVLVVSMQISWPERHIFRGAV